MLAIAGADLFLAAGIALLGVFVAIERRSSHPLLPLRVLADRNRGGSYLALLFVAIGMFGMFLFLTYYVQETLGYTTAFTWSVVIFAVGGLCCGLLLRSGRGQESELAAEPPAEPAVADQPALPQTSAQAA